MTIAYLLIDCELGSEESIISQLKKIDQVKDVFGTFGVHDIIAKVESENIENLRGIISSKIQRIEKIRSTVTLFRK